MANIDCKVVVLGQQGIGKTCLVDRFVSNHFDGKYRSTSSAGFSAKKVTIADGRVLRLGVWDTAGDPAFTALTRAYLKGVHAAIVCVSLQHPPSYHRAKAWTAQLLEATNQSAKVYLAVLRCDLLCAEERGCVRQALADAVDDTNIIGLHCLDPDADPTGEPSDDAPPGTVDVAEHAGYLAAYSSLIKAPLCLTSAASGAGVADLFQRVVQDCGSTIPLGNECEAHTGTSQHMLPGVPLLVQPASPTDLQAPLLPPSPSEASDGGMWRALERWCCCWGVTGVS